MTDYNTQAGFEKNKRDKDRQSFGDLMKFNLEPELNKAERNLDLVNATQYLVSNKRRMH